MNLVIASSTILKIFNKKLVQFILFSNLMQNCLVLIEQFLKILASIAVMLIMSETTIAAALATPLTLLEATEIAILRRLATL
jgi:hypothetical protein